MPTANVPRGGDGGIAIPVRPAWAGMLLVMLVVTVVRGGPVPLQAQAPRLGSWRVQLDLGFQGALGNSDFGVLKAGAGVTHLRRELAELTGSVNQRYGTRGGDVIQNSLKMSLKLDVHPKATWSPFTFVEALHDPIRKLSLRSSGGVGGKYTYVETSRGKASVSAAFLFDYESVMGDAKRPSVTEKGARWSLRVKEEWRFGAGASVEHIMFLQPRWDWGGDYFIDMDTSISTRMTSALSLVVRHEWQRDSTPPEGVGSDDHNFSVGFRCVF